jgi:spore cortex formation protein SpoVR/YcgB (stage V sporulation)
MYDFYYNTIKNKYNDKVSLLYTDKDSLIMEIKTDDFYKNVKNSLISEFDTSDYPENNVYNIPLVNKKVLGKFKDKLNGQIMNEFTGLRSKLYAYKIFENGKEVKKS